MEIILFTLLVFVLVWWFRDGRKMEVNENKAPYKLETPVVEKNKEMEIVPPFIDFEKSVIKMSIQNTNPPTETVLPKEETPTVNTTLTEEPKKVRKPRKPKEDKQVIKKADSIEPAVSTPKRRGRSKKI